MERLDTAEGDEHVDPLAALPAQMMPDAEPAAAVGRRALLHQRRRTIAVASTIVAVAATAALAAALTSGSGAADKSAAHQFVTSKSASPLAADTPTRAAQLSPSAQHQVPTAGLRPYEPIADADRLRRVGQHDPAYVDVAYLMNRTFVVYRSNEPTDVTILRYRRAVPVGVVVTSRQALLSTSQDDTITRLVSSNLRWLGAHGVDVESWGAGTPGPYAIGFSGARPSDALLTRFLRYGPGTVIFRRDYPATY